MIQGIRAATVGSSRSALRFGTSAFALMLGGMIFATSAVAQDAPAGASAVEGEDVVVTGSRISRSGFEAPSPMTVLNADDLAKQGAPNVAAALNLIPSFRPGTTPATSTIDTGGAQNILDLRGLGSTRTLVLLDGRRHVATTTTGRVNVDLIPQALIKRVEVVTGGASAAYGSDAVAGVVNFIFDHEFTGLKGSGQVGLTGAGDNREYRVSLAYGTHFADGRGHFAIAGELYDGNGILAQRDRDWSSTEAQLINNPAYKAGNGEPIRLRASPVRQSNRSQGGMITTGRFKGMQFLPGGVLSKADLGTFDNGTYHIGGDGASQSLSVSLIPPSERHNVSAILSYDITDNVRAIFEGSYSSTRSGDAINENSSGAAYTIQRDNAYLPASMSSLMAAGETFSMGRVNTDFGLYDTDARSKTYRAVAALEGDFGNSWKWSAYYQFGRTQSDVSIYRNVITANLTRAIDAVNSGGQVVCRVNADANPNNNDASCVPINLFGNGSPSAAAIGYVTGTQNALTTLRQNVVAADIQGEPFSTWAGPVSIAFGGEYRDESVNVTSDPISQAGGFAIGNPKRLQGGFNVKEAFAEAVVPLLKDSPVGKSLDFNGAVRFTDYSLTGSVTTWKVGLTYEIVDGVRLRATRSRDIRAPNIVELFTEPRLGFNTLRDPTNGSTVLVNLHPGGNPSLTPEKGDTLTAGIVLQPSAVPGLRLAVDYYDIKLNNVIALLGPQSILDRCFGGATELCSLITRNSAGVITDLNTFYLNLASRHARGVDMELSYATPLSRIADSWTGNLSARVLATYVDTLSTSDGVVTTERAGEVGEAVNGDMPHWRFTTNVAYDNGPLNLSLTGRYVGGGKYSNAFVDRVDINDNTISARFYLDASIGFNILDRDGQKVELFGVVNNIMDQDPPIIPIGFQLGLQTNSAHYDVVGRSFVAGVRFKF